MFIFNFSCHIPECEDSNSTFAVPWWPNETDRCSKPLLRNGSADACAADHFTGQVEPCTQWVYEHRDSAITEVCLII